MRKAVHALSLIFSLEYFAGFSLSIINIAGRISKAAIGAQRPLLPFCEPKKMGARSARARTSGQNPLF